jgi:putative ABC transport system permease protein
MLFFYNIRMHQDGLLLLLILVIGLLAGIYPSFVLSKTNLINAVKGKIDSARGGLTLKRGLLVVQFSLAVFVFICTLNVSKQVSYIFNKDLGYSKDQIMFFPMRGDNMFKNIDAFENDLVKVPGVSSVSIGYGFPGDAVAGDEIIVPHNSQQTSQSCKASAKGLAQGSIEIITK